MSNITAVSIEDIQTAVYEYLLNYSTPGINSNNIIRGWQNNATLPKDNEFITYAILLSERHGTGIKESKALDSSLKETLAEYKLFDVQLDFYSSANNDNALSRASYIELMSRSEEGVNFFKARDIGLNYCDSIKQVDFIDGTDNYVKRCITTLKLGAWFKADFDRDNFDKVYIKVKQI